MTFLAQKISRPCQILQTESRWSDLFLARFAPKPGKEPERCFLLPPVEIFPLSKYATSNFQSDQVVSTVHGAY
jgi:hypothetical protein